MRARKFFYPLICGVLLLFPSSGAAQYRQQERVISFQSLISIQSDATINVTETIKVWATGNTINHGVYRDFPTDYKDRMGIRYHVGFQVTSVERDGAPENYRLARRSNGVRIYMGNKETSVAHGEHTYTLSYTTNRQIGFFEKFDELYWNVTGNGWDLPISAASATFELPPGASLLSTDGYTGPYGSTAKHFSVSQDFFGRPVFQTTVPLGVHEGLTAVVSWPKGFVQKPSPADQAQYFIQDNQGLIAAIFGLLLLFIYYLAVWYLLGRDPKKGTIIPLYRPPFNLCPASIRMIRQMGFDNKTFTVAILNMAVKNHLTIIEKESALLKFIGAGKTYSLKKDPAEKTSGTGQSSDVPAAELTTEELAVSQVLFGSDNEIELDDRNHQIIRAAISALRRRLSKKLEKVYFLTNKEFFSAGILLSILVGFFSLSLLESAGGSALLVIVGIVLLNVIFHHLLKAPTMQGRKVMDQIEGFRMFLSVTEKDRLQLLNRPEKTPELFERYLPYAMALDVEQAWGEQFSEILRRAAESGEYHPSWYYGYGMSWKNFNAASFATGLNSSFSSAISSASTPPGSSSGGGGGGFSGGGGGW